VQVANELTEQIANGRFPVGCFLPTELELCRHYNISRHTVREALRRLHDGGLVSRRRGSGTEVISLAPATSFKQPINSIEDLLQYGGDTQLRLGRRARITCSGSLAKLLDCEKGREWLRIETIRARQHDPSPICVTTLYLNVDLPDIEEHIRHLSGPVSAMIERVYKLRISRIEQSIRAVSVKAPHAKVLGVETGSPALRALRRYFDETGRLLEFSDSIHPGERFTYVMQLLRD
jgi:DNA-binding GntR family transcriptional regulator